MKLTFNYYCANMIITPTFHHIYYLSHEASKITNLTSFYEEHIKDKIIVNKNYDVTFPLVCAQDASWKMPHNIQLQKVNTLNLFEIAIIFKDYDLFNYAIQQFKPNNNDDYDEYINLLITAHEVYIFDYMSWILHVNKYKYYIYMFVIILLLLLWIGFIFLIAIAPVSETMDKYKQLYIKIVYVIYTFLITMCLITAIYEYISYATYIFSISLMLIILLFIIDLYTKLSITFNDVKQLFLSKE